MKIDVIIPTYHPDDKLDKNLAMLARQTIRPDRILLINTEESLFKSRVFPRLDQGQIKHIRKAGIDGLPAQRRKSVKALPLNRGFLVCPRSSSPRGISFLLYRSDW